MKKYPFHKSEKSRVLTYIKKTWDKKMYRILFGGILGAGAGWLYWEFIGCNGSCPLTSSAPQTIIIFSLFGMWYNYRK